MNAILAFTGHRPNKLGGYSPVVTGGLIALAIEFLKPRRDRIQCCYSGMALGWDQAIALACIDLKIPFVAAVPFVGQESQWPLASQEKFRYILSCASGVKYVCEPGYAAWKMQKRNEFMVDNSHALIALWDSTSGGTANCVRYAETKGKRVKNLWAEWSGGTR